MTADDVAQYLKENPGFFQQRAGLFTELLLPNPHEGNAVSLAERQVLLLRERVHALETRLAELLQIGRDNDNLARVLVDWTRALLAEPECERRRQVASRELQRLFGVPLVEIRIWNQPPSENQVEVARFVSAMAAPTCGTDVDLRPIPGLGPAWSVVRSAAMVPLRGTQCPGAFGLILLGSADPDRFQASLGTALLSRIGELASAALAPRIVDAAGRDHQPSAPPAR